MRAGRVFGAGLALVFLWGSGWAGTAPVAGLEARLAELVAAGELDRARADLYRLYAVLAAERLPPELRVEAPEGRAWKGDAPAVAEHGGHRCGTPVLRGVGARLGAMPAEIRTEAEGLLAPPRPAAARSAAQVGGKAFSPVLPNWVLTENFSIQWGPDLTNEDGSTPARDEDASGIPDVVERWAELFEASFRAVAQVLKAGDPLSVYAGTPIATHRIPVYLGNSSASTTIENISPGTYAFTQDIAPIPYVVVNNDLRFVPPNDEGTIGPPKIRGAMKITAAHEFFHVVHFLYEPSVWNVTQDDWWLETSATWMEDEVFGGVNDHRQYYGSPGWASFVEAGLPVPFGDTHYVTRAYGGAIFAKYLSEHVGGRAMMGELWDLIRSPGRRILEALEVYSTSRGFEDLGDLFLGFAAANAVMDYEEGATYGAVPVRKNSLTADSTADGLPAIVPLEQIPVPSYLGATYLSEPGGGEAGVQVSLSGAPSARWGLSLVLVHPQGYSLAVGTSASNGQATISVTSVADFDAVYAIPSYLTPAGASTSYATAATAAAGGDQVPPGEVGSLFATPAAGGFDASWSPPGASDVAGYVVRWKPGGAVAFAGSRTLVAPATTAEVRGLPAGTYDVEIFAYDTSGNRGPAPAVPLQVVSEAGIEPPIPPADEIILEMGQGTPSSGGGGGGGGGCFVDSLRLQQSSSASSPSL